jgi:hypothetical protein
MQSRSLPRKKNIKKKFWLEAEHYSLEEAANIYHPHPEGLPGISRNCLLLGYPGVGKTLVLKKLCYDLRNTENILPLYIQIEPWVAAISAETTYPITDRFSPRDRDMTICTNILLTLAIIDKLRIYADKAVVAAAIAHFPNKPSSLSAIPSWTNEQINLVRNVVEYGGSLPESYASFPNLFMIMNSIGKVSREKDKTIVLLVDQIDKTQAFHFNAVSSLLRRGEYVVVIASRPCPCAPEAPSIPHGIINGTDYTIHWLGCDARSSAWRRFINDIIISHGFFSQATEVVIDKLQQTTSLVGPSPRNILAICEEIECKIENGKPADSAWVESISSLINSDEAIAADNMGAWCSDPHRVLTILRDQASLARRSKGPGPVALSLKRGDKLFLSQKAENLIRVCIREGILLPMPREKLGLDALLEDFEVRPTLIAPKEPIAIISKFNDEIVIFEIDTQKIESWTEHIHRLGKRSQKNIFIAHWMSDPETPGNLAQRLKNNLLEYANVITGDYSSGSPQWSIAIRDLVKKADLVVVDLSTLRRDVFVELGWAIGYCRQALLGISDAASIGKKPNWLRERQIHPFESDIDFKQFLRQILELLNKYPNRCEQWLDDPFDESIIFRPEIRRVGIIGGDKDWISFEGELTAACEENKFIPESLCISGTKLEGGILFDVIKVARKAGTLILIYDGSLQTDLLLCIAGGIFSSKDYISGQQKSQRRLILVNNSSSTDRQVLPGLLRTRPKTIMAQKKEITAILRSHLIEINNYLRETEKNRFKEIQGK